MVIAAGCKPDGGETRPLPCPQRSGQEANRTVSCLQGETQSQSRTIPHTELQSLNMGRLLMTGISKTATAETGARDPGPRFSVGLTQGCIVNVASMGYTCLALRTRSSCFGLAQEDMYHQACGMHVYVCVCLHMHGGHHMSCSMAPTLC